LDGELEAKVIKPEFRTGKTIFGLIFTAAFVTFAAVRPIVHALHREFFFEPDSIGYLSLAANMLKGRGFRLFTRDWCSDWPPLYPALLGSVDFFVNDPVRTAGIASTVCFATTILTAYVWLGRLTSSILVRLIAVAFLTFDQAITNLYNSALSESLFIPLSLICIYLTDRCVATDRRRYFYLSAVSALACCLTRYIGVTIVAAVVLALAMRTKRPVRRNILECAFYVGLVLAPMTCWCLINHHFTGEYMGERDPGTNSFHDCLMALFQCITNGVGGHWVLWFLVVIALVGMTASIVSKSVRPFGPVRTGLLFIVLYAITVVWSSSRYNIDMIDDRLTSPLIVPLVCVSIGLFEPLRSSLGRIPRFVTTTVTGGIFAIAAVVSLSSPQVPSGGYLAQMWQFSPTLAYVEHRRFESPIYSNDSAAIYFITNKVSDWVADESDDPTMDSVEADVQSVPARSYVVWLHNALEPEDFNSNELAAKCDMKIDAQFSDGVVYRRSTYTVVNGGQ
jgi:hypothetical protein